MSRTREGLPAASCRIEALLRQDGKGPEKTLGHMGRLRVGELVGRVLGAVVMGIAVKGRVRDHQGAVAVAPERAVIAPGDARDEPEGRDVLQREARMGAKVEVGDEAEEIAAVGVEEPEEGRIALPGSARYRAGRVIAARARNGLASALTRAQNHAWMEALAPSSGSIE